MCYIDCGASLIRHQSTLQCPPCYSNRTALWLNRVFFTYCIQADELPAVSQTAAAESDSDSGVGSPAEEMVPETASKREDLPGEVTKQ